LQIDDAMVFYRFDWNGKYLESRAGKQKKKYLIEEAWRVDGEWVDQINYHTQQLKKEKTQAEQSGPAGYSFDKTAADELVSQGDFVLGI
jgi:hypothetical protein